MAISHVATVGVGNTDNIGRTSAQIPATVAVGDLVFVAGAFRDDLGQLADAGFQQIVNTLDPTRGSDFLNVWWARWVAGMPTSYLVTTGNVPFSGYSNSSGTGLGEVAVWRGARGMRDVATLVNRYNPTGSTDPGIPMAWPGANAGAGDQALLFACYQARRPSAFGVKVNSTSPATTVRLAALENLGAYVGDEARATVGTTPAYTGDQNTYSYYAATVALCGVLAPLGAVLLNPTSGSTVDLTTGGTVSFRHVRAGVQGSASGGANAYALRRKVGAGAYEYWNAGTATWGATITWNSITVPGNDVVNVAFPSGKWVDNTSYTVSAATQEDAANTQGTFGTEVTFTVRVKPTVTVTAPATTQTTTSPTVAWTPAPASGASYTGWHLRVFDSDTYGAAGFDPNDPDGFPPAYDSGERTTTFTSDTATGLHDATTYKAYVTVRQTGNEWSDWTPGVAWPVSVTAQAAPALTVTPIVDDGCPRLQVIVQGRDNVLSADEAAFEGASAPGTVGTNTTKALSAAQKIRGSQSMLLTRTTSTGDISWITDRHPDGPGEHRLRVPARPATTARSFRGTLTFYDADSVVLGSIVAAGVETAGAWTEATAMGVAPEGTAQSDLLVEVLACASGEQHYIDGLSARPGTVSAWSTGGLAASGTVELDYSEDGGASWQPVRGAAALVLDSGQTAVVDDYETQWGAQTQYRARRSYVAGTDTIASAWSSDVAGVLSPGGCGWWLLDPIDPSTAMSLGVTNDAPRKVDPRVTVLDPPSRAAQIVVKGVTGLKRGTETAVLDTEAEEEALLALLGSGATLLMHSSAEGPGYPRRRYLAPTGEFESTRQVQRSIPGKAWTAARLVDFDWTEQDRP